MDTKRILALYDQDRMNVRLFGMQREETSHVVRHISSDGEGLIIYSDLQSTNAEKVIQEQIAHFRMRRRDLRWIVYQHDTPPNLRDLLLTYGFRAEEPEAIMVLDLEHVSSALLDPIPHPVQRITDPYGIDDVVTIRREIWEGDYSSTAQALANRLTDAPQSLGLYVAYVDGKPASTAQISFYPRGHFASLVHAATLPAYRGRGLYTALVAIRVQEARRRGMRFLDTDASPMSRPILEKLGFRWLTEAHPCTWRAQHAPSV